MGMATFIIVIAILAGAYYIAQTLRENADKDRKNTPEYKKEVEKIDDSLRERAAHNILAHHSPETSLEYPKEIIKQMKKKYPDGIKIQLPFEEWPPLLKNKSEKLDHESGETLVREDEKDES